MVIEEAALLVVIVIVLLFIFSNDDDFIYLLLLLLLPCVVVVATLQVVSRRFCGYGVCVGFALLLVGIFDQKVHWGVYCSGYCRLGEQFVQKQQLPFCMLLFSAGMNSIDDVLR